MCNEAVAQLFTFCLFVFVTHRKSRDNHSSQLEKSLEKISEKLERLSIEHRALKFEKKEADKRLRQLEAGKELKENEH